MSASLWNVSIAIKFLLSEKSISKWFSKEREETVNTVVILVPVKVMNVKSKLFVRNVENQFKGKKAIFPN